MNILLIGSGGREHALARKLAESPLCEKLFIAPGNAGTRNNGTNVNIGVTDFDAMFTLVQQENIEMIVVGPEIPLVEGVVDYFAAKPETAAIPVIGPSKAAAQLEGSKSFAKAFMARHNVPTAQYMEVTAENLGDGLAHIDASNTPIVLKADGLAAGKGVLICQTKEEAKAELQDMIQNQRFGDASAKVVIEEFLDGIEFSVFALSDGDHYQLFPAAKDYKRIGEGDTGLNTGGMGAVTPLAFVDDELMQKVEERVVIPSLQGMKAEGNPFVGFLYCGLIKVGNEPYVIEYNARLGDPETEVLIPSLESDLVEVFTAVGNKTLDSYRLHFTDKACATIIMAAGGYPGSYEKGKPITNLEAVNTSIVYHAGTKEAEGQIVTSGGRVLAVTSFGKTLQDAVATSLKNVDLIQFEGKTFRRDIGQDVFVG